MVSGEDNEYASCNLEEILTWQLLFLYEAAARGSSQEVSGLGAQAMVRVLAAYITPIFWDDSYGS